MNPPATPPPAPSPTLFSALTEHQAKTRLQVAFIHPLYPSQTHFSVVTGAHWAPHFPSPNPLHVADLSPAHIFAPFPLFCIQDAQMYSEASREVDIIEKYLKNSLKKSCWGGKMIWLLYLRNFWCFVRYWLFPVFFSFFFLLPPPPSLCMNFHSGANVGAITLNSLGTLLFNNDNNKKRVIFVFLYLNICYLNDMLVYRLTVHRQKYFYSSEDITR